MREIGLDEEPLGQLFGRLLEDGQAVARAEIEVAKQTVVGRLAGARTAIILVVIAIMLVQASFTTLLATIAVALRPLTGPWGGFAIATVVGLVFAGILVKLALRSFAAGAGKAEQ